MTHDASRIGKIKSAVFNLNAALMRIRILFDNSNSVINTRYSKSVVDLHA